MANPYDFTPELKRKILIAIQMRKAIITCPVCGHNTWEMPDGFATVPLLKNVWTNERTSGLPSAAYICTTCGYTMLFNLVALGFKDALGPDTSKWLRPDVE